MLNDCAQVISVDIVTIISDTLYSDSPEVIDALADLFEELIVKAHQKPASEVRMNQVRYIIQVDESTFKSQFTPEQLKTIESKEMESILGDLLSAVSLQRFRFSERQKSGTSVTSYKQQYGFAMRLRPFRFNR